MASCEPLGSEGADSSPLSRQDTLVRARANPRDETDPNARAAAPAQTASQPGSAALPGARPEEGRSGQVPGRIAFRSLLIGAAGAVFVVIFQVVNKAMPRTVALPLGSVTTVLPGVVLWLAA